MARPNHQFEKRQRELAKKKKKEEKQQRKLDRKSDAIKDEAPVASEDTESEDPTT